MDDSAAVLMSKGKLLDKVERYDEAFEAFAEGNRLRSVAYDPTTYERAAERYISVWTSDLIERLARSDQSRLSRYSSSGCPGRARV